MRTSPSPSFRIFFPLQPLLIISTPATVIINLIKNINLPTYYTPSLPINLRKLYTSFSLSISARSSDIELQSCLGAFCEAWAFLRNKTLSFRQNPVNHLVDTLKLLPELTLFPHWYFHLVFAVVCVCVCVGGGGRVG